MYKIKVPFFYFSFRFEENSTKIAEFRASYGGMGPTTRLATKSNALMIGKDWNPNTLREMTDSLSEGFGSNFFTKSFTVFLRFDRKLNFYLKVLINKE